MAVSRVNCTFYLYVINSINESNGQSVITRSIFRTLQSNPISYFLLIKHYNLCKVLTCSTTFFQLSLFYATFFQLPMFMLFISPKMSSSQRVLGLPISLLDMGFHLLIFCTILSSAMRSTWPNQFNICFLINPITFCPFNISFA